MGSHIQLTAYGLSTRTANIRHTIGKPKKGKKKVKKKHSKAPARVLEKRDGYLVGVYACILMVQEAYL
jgi:hypothetical protein